MFKIFAIVLIAAVAICTAEPEAKAGVFAAAAPLVSAPFVAATSSQVFHRNYNGLVSAPIAAPFAAPYTAAAAYPFAAPYTAAAAYPFAAPYTAAGAAYPYAAYPYAAAAPYTAFPHVAAPYTAAYPRYAAAAAPVLL